MSVFSAPSGVIVFWSGTLANIPTGWALCNGSSGTPDLRNKFVKGAAVGDNPGGTGGAATHDHDDHASRTHSGATLADHPAMTHSGLTIANHTTILKDTGTGNPISLNPTHSITQHSGHVAQSHTISAQATAHSARTHSTDNHEPVFFKLAYIMKL